MITKKKNRNAIEFMEELNGGPLTFGQMLKAERECEDLSIRAFAKVLDICPSSLADLESGRKIPSPERAAKIARKLKDSAEYFVYLATRDFLAKAGFALNGKVTKLKKKKVA